MRDVDPEGIMSLTEHDIAVGKAHAAAGPVERQVESQIEAGMAGMRRSLQNPEPAPVHNDQPAVWDLVIKDMHLRDVFGLEKYGTRLQPNNGRDALVDAYQEILDAAVYLRQMIFEREGR